MSQSDPVQSMSQRLWSLALSALGLVIVANVVWSLVRPLLPVLAVMAVLVLALAVLLARYRSRW